MRLPGSRPRPWRWALLLGALAYLAVAVGSLHLDWARLVAGTGRGRRFLAAFLHPTLQGKGPLIASGLLESLTMTVASTVLGMLAAVPAGFLSARNLVSRPLYLTMRGLIVVSRTFHELVVAILFVALLGFGPLAGVLTLVFGTVGFVAKLLAEDIENTERAPLEAIAATGAGRTQLWLWAVLPQVRPRIWGLALYRLDINFRESSVLGVVGAGGIGGTLSTAVERGDFGVAAAILGLVVGIVFLLELASGRIRRRLL
jgi:phosphonate transport system permease protein